MGLPFRVKRGVDTRKVHPQLWVHIYQIAVRHQDVTGHRMVITSLTRGADEDSRSYHNPKYASDRHALPIDLATAFDMRRWYFRDFPQLEKFCIDTKQQLDIGCLIEPEWMSEDMINARRDGVVPHVHWQLSPRNVLWLSHEGQLL